MHIKKQFNTWCLTEIRVKIQKLTMYYKCWILLAAFVFKIGRYGSAVVAGAPSPGPGVVRWYSMTTKKTPSRRVTTIWSTSSLSSWDSCCDCALKWSIEHSLDDIDSIPLGMW